MDNPVRQNPTGIMWQAIRDNENNIKLVVNQLNNLIGKMQVIDAVAYAALLLHGDQEFVLTDENVEIARKKIEAVKAEMDRYREELDKKLKEQKAKQDEQPAPSGEAG